jgi:hypothetical protein
MNIPDSTDVQPTAETRPQELTFVFATQSSNATTRETTFLGLHLRPFIHVPMPVPSVLHE